MTDPDKNKNPPENPDQPEQADKELDRKLPENSKQELDRKLEDALEETFPTSDPVSVSITR